MMLFIIWSVPSFAESQLRSVHVLPGHVWVFSGFLLQSKDMLVILTVCVSVGGCLCVC